MDKIDIFEYIIYKLLEWYKLNNPDKLNNNFTILKVIKLHFFVVAGKLKHDSDYKLLDIFNNWYALPLGPIEYDVNDYFINGKLNYYNINNHETKLKDNINIDDLINSIDTTIKKDIGESISYIKEKSKYNELVDLPQFDLIDLSKTWYCWKKPFSIAKSDGRLSEKIDSNIIRMDDKNYQIRYWY